MTSQDVSTVQQSGTLTWRSTDWIGVALVYLVAFGIYFIPVVMSNEASYLIASRRIIDPSFLASDWEVMARTSGSMTSALFDFIAVPFWYLIREPHFVAMALRSVLIVLLLWSLFRLIRELRVPPAYAAIGLCLWLLFGQSIAADAWIVGGAEKKVIAYAFIFASLTALLRKQTARAGIFAGLAVVGHVLVGAWYCLAAGVTMLVLQRRVDRDVLRFGIWAAVLALPIFLSAIFFAADATFDSGNYLGMSAAELVVTKRNPHHGDPAAFMNFRQLVEFVVFFSAAFLAAWYAFKGRPRTIMISILACTLLMWLAGFVARYFGFFGFLHLFPFRIGDVFVPMVVAIAAVPALQQAVPVVLKPGHWLPRLFGLACAGAVLAATLIFVDIAVPRSQGYVQRTIDGWRFALHAESDPELRMAGWIRGNTADTDVFMTPPLGHWFKLYAERPVVASFKGVPGNRAIHEWFRRLETLVGGQEVVLSGYEMIDWAEETYGNLDATQLSPAFEQYCAQYYLVARPRPEFATAEVYSAAPWHLYRISTLVGSPAPANCR